MNCVRATNEIFYASNVIDVSQRNFPGYISLFVTLNVGHHEDEDSRVLSTLGTYSEFHLEDYYIREGKVMTEASAYFATNVDVDSYYRNRNYSIAYTEYELEIP